MKKAIIVQGAKEHNLKNINVEIPIGKITCIVGPSGSGKSSLAFHTLYAESKRRFLNSFPNYLKFFSDRPAPVSVDSIEPVLPVFGLPQNNPIVGTRLSVADVMQATDILSNLYANFAIEKCPEHNEQLVEVSISNHFKALEKNIEDNSIIHFFITKDEFIDNLAGQALPSRSLKSKRTKTITDFDKDHQFWEVVRVRPKHLPKLDDKLVIYTSKKMQIYYAIEFENKIKSIKELNFKQVEKCPLCDYKAHEVTKQSFNPHNPIGACSECNGFGSTLEVDEEKIVDKNKSMKEGGIKLLETKKFSGISNELIKDARSLKISTTKPIKDLDEDFWELLYSGHKNFVGVQKLIKYLEGKKYKAHVRIFLRSIQKEEVCLACDGSRITPQTHNFCLFKEFIPFKMMTLKTVSELLSTFNDYDLISTEDKAKKLAKKLIKNLKTAEKIGLSHLILNRKAKSVSAGEYQRLLLLKYLSYEGTGSLFIFDEPSLGLAEDEITKLFEGFENLIKQGNTVLIVEHSEIIQKLSDHIIKMGPGPGHLGGEVVSVGKYKKDNLKLNFPEVKKKNFPIVKVKGPSIYGKVFRNFEIYKGGFNWVYGKSGTGKSSCLINILANEINYKVYNEYLKVKRGQYLAIQGDTQFDDVIIINANISRYTSRSTVGSSTDLFSIVRKHFLNLSQAKSMGLKEGHLSTNSQLGQCPKCEGKGHNVIEMQFLEDVIVECEDCHGKGLKDIYANLTDGEMTVYESYHMPIGKILEKIRLTPKYQKIFDYMQLLNLSYLSLGRSIRSLSGGEKQRIYLLSKLQKKIKNSLIIFENISFGLSELELCRMIHFLIDLQESGNNTIVVIDQDQLFKRVANNEIKFD